MSAPDPVAAMLPEPPDDHGWSVVTLAAHLCVPAHVVWAEVDEDTDVSRDRSGASFDDADNWPQGDVYLWPAAAERIAALHPAATIARAIIDNPGDLLGKVQRISGPALLHMARHIVDYAGGQA